MNSQSVEWSESVITSTHLFLTFARLITYLTVKAISIPEYLNTVMSNWIWRYRKEVDVSVIDRGQWRSSSSLSLPSFDLAAPPSPSLEPESLAESSDCQPACCCWVACCCTACFETLWRLPARDAVSAPAPSSIGCRIRRRALINQLFTCSSVKFVWLAIWRFSSSVG